MPPEQLERARPTRGRRSSAITTTRRGAAKRGPARRGPAGRGPARDTADTLGTRVGPRYTAFGIVAALALFLAISERSIVRLVYFLDYSAGVIALLSLTASVLWGLAATDRLVLGPGHRLVAQAVHRGTAVAGLGFLGLHIWAKVTAGSTSSVSAAVPFLPGAPQSFVVGLGTVAGYLFLAVAVTGAVRGVFARNGRSRWWRAMHMCAYLAWGVAVVHGLRAGRGVEWWVMAGYVVCLAGVTAVLTMRLVPRRGAPRISTRKKEQP
ncbi:MAG: hypothetical protein ACRDP3_15545 [Streptomyces sp.]|uniref:hypothetical protein n=1 Tax=Streptomyces sp. TaxID=1931 RepID=UPI003D6C1CCB